MSTAEVRAHHAAVLAVLRAIAPGPLPAAYLGVHDGEVTSPPNDPTGRVHPYCVLYGGPGDAATSALSAEYIDLWWTFQVTCVAGTPTGAYWARDKVTAALAGAALTVPGRTVLVRPDGHDEGPLRRDDDLTPPRFWIPTGWRAQSVPA